MKYICMGCKDVLPHICEEKSVCECEHCNPKDEG